MVVHAYNLVLGRLRQEDYKFQVSLGFIARPCLKKSKPGSTFIYFVVVH
jgi:hypothetical protein